MFLSKSDVHNYFLLARLHSLWGAALLMFPSLWSLVLFYNYNLSNYVVIYYFISFIIGSIIMRSVGCIINDICDKDFDAQIPRTQSRPIATGKISVKQAWKFILILMIIPALIFISFPNFAKVVCVCSLILVVIYPLCKRFFSVPQFVLGLAFNWGILLADAVMNSHVSMNAIILYIGSVIWTLVYDTVYAYQDYQYDHKIGVKSFTAIVGNHARLILPLLMMCFALFLIIVGYLMALNMLYYVVIIGSCLFIIQQLLVMDYNNPVQCFIFFKKNIVFSILVLIAILVSK